MGLKLSEVERQKLAAISRRLREQWQHADVKLFGFDLWRSHQAWKDTESAMAAFLDELAQRCRNDVVDSEVSDQTLVAQGGEQQA